MAKKGGLGKGLEALFVDNATADGEHLTTLRISQVEPNKEQPRREFEAAALGELADSIREHGILQPLIVRPLEGDRYQIVAGERRWRAARMAGLTEVPAIVRELDDLVTMELALIENLQREDLTPLEEAEGYRSLMELYGMTQEQVARRVGKSRPVIANALRLLSLPEEVRRTLAEGKISAGHARVLVSAVSAQEIVSTGLQQGILSAESLEAMIRQGEESDSAIECNYFALSMKLDDTEGSALIPVIRPLSQEETESAGQENSSSGEEGVSMAVLSQFQLEGTALIQDYTLTTVLSQEITQGLCFLLEESDSPVLVLQHEDTTLSARLHQASSSWSVSETQAHLSIQAKASIDELLQPGQRESENDFSQMEQQASDEIASLCQKAYQAVAQYQANVLELIDKLKWSDGETWETASTQPEEFLASLPFTVDVTVTFDRTGLETNQKVNG